MYYNGIMTYLITFNFINIIINTKFQSRNISNSNDLKKLFSFYCECNITKNK